MNWIRIATKMKSDPKIGRLAASCDVTVAHAVGLVTCLLLEFPEHAKTGSIAEVDAFIIEEWAGWRGDRGLFAAAFEEHFCDESGTVTGWERHNGAAIRKSEADSQRRKDAAAARLQRDGSAVAAHLQRDGSAETAQKPRGKRAAVGVTRRDETTSSTNVDDDGASSSSVEQSVLLAHFADPAHRDAVIGYVRSAQFPRAVASHLAVTLDPNGGNVAPEHVGKALHEMRLNGVSAFRASVFSGFLRRVRTAPAGKPLTWDDLMVPTEVRDVA